MVATAPAARLASDDERARWDALIAANPGGGEVWQGDEYLGVKERQGRYLPRRVIVERASADPVAVGVLAKRVPLLGEWWHVPAGPGSQSAEEAMGIASAVAELARSQGAFLLKVEPRIPLAEGDALRAAGYRDAVRIIPNPSTVLVDVSADPDADADAREAEVFARLGKKARNSINRARRDGIVAEQVPASDENCAALYRLLQETAEGRFVLRSEAYYRDFWQSFERAGSSEKDASRSPGSGAEATASGSGRMFFASRDGELLAGAFAMGLGSKTTYKDGASLREKRAYGASHALQWEVIRWAVSRGATTHDLCGAPPSEQAGDPQHPLHGVGQFKRSFAPGITDYAGAFDLPLRPRAYAVWTRIGDRLARRASLAIMKDPYY